MDLIKELAKEGIIYGEDGHWYSNCAIGEEITIELNTLQKKIDVELEY